MNEGVFEFSCVGGIPEPAECFPEGKALTREPPVGRAHDVQSQQRSHRRIEPFDLVAILRFLA
ncbi:hypothetical protein D9M72_456560 [compost metagenome]